MTRIGVFGGQFDPPHNGHLAVVRAARDQLGLDQMLIVPSARPPHRPDPATPAETRYRLAQAAFAAEPGVEVSRIELDRDGPGYTVETLEALAGPDRELYLILGADQLAAMASDRRRGAAGGAAGGRGCAARDGAGRCLVLRAASPHRRGRRRPREGACDRRGGDHTGRAVPPDPVLG
jgi:cytidyltransferase-like protein